MAAHDVPPTLVKVKAKVLVVGVVGGGLFSPEEASRLIAEVIPGTRLFLCESPLGYLGCAMHLDRASDAIFKFIAEAEKNWCQEAWVMVTRDARAAPDPATRFGSGH